ncbi:MAG: hypothetical protein ACRDHW_02060 [Ktedonobacteraceae bacterium]
MNTFPFLHFLTNEIHERFGGERALIAVLDPAELAELPDSATGQFHLPELPEGVHQVRTDGPRVWFSFGKETLPAHELVVWPGARHRLKDVTFQEPEIEDVIRQIYEENLLVQEVELAVSRRILG